MKHLLLRPLLALILAGAVLLSSATAQTIEIGSAEFEFPNPAFPYYHFIIEADLPNETYIDVTVRVNGKALRFTELLSKSEFAQIDIHHPAIAYRPPSAYALSENNQKYRDIVVVGWYRWESGKEYTLEVEARLKKSEDQGDDDLIVRASKSVRSPQDAATYSMDWRNYKSIVVSETAGIDRIGEPVEVLLPFYLDESENIQNDFRIVAYNQERNNFQEIPGQLFDVMTYSEVDDPSSHQRSNSNEQVPYWHPTRTARLTFLADVPAKSSQIYLVYYNNPEAEGIEYNTDLEITGNDSVGTTISNKHFTAILDPRSGALQEVALNSRSDEPLYHGKETNGAIQWNPDIYSPPTPWDHTSDWISPYQKSFAGPVNFELNTWGTLNEYWGVEASNTYKFYASVPYLVFSSSMRMKETIQTLALRNGEMVFDRELLDRVSWYDVFRDSVITYDLHALPTLTELRMVDDLPWITFYSSRTGVAFAGIQLGYMNSGIDNVPRLLNPSFYVTIGPWVYWARALSVSYVSANHQQVIPAMAGNTFSEKWAFMMYDTRDSESGSPYSPVEEWYEKLNHPLKIKLVEEVDDRVSRSIDEIMSGGKSPWEK